MSTKPVTACCDAQAGPAVPFSEPAIRQHVPAILRETPHWVCWKRLVRNGKPTKVPVDPRTGRNASTTDPGTWGSLENALAAVRRDNSLAGVGFVFTAYDPFAGIDLDNCIADGVIVPPALTIIEEFASYTERSPGGRGVKIFIRGKKPAGASCWSNTADGFDHIEVYDDKRFFVVTGCRLEDTTASVEDRQSQLNSLCRRLWPASDALSSPPIPPPPAAGSSASTGSEIDMAERERRCIAYLSRCPDAISGSGGHNSTLRAACECYRFDLDDAAARRVMEWFNGSKCGGETWTETELAHKLASARSKVEARAEFGCRLLRPGADDSLVSSSVAGLTTDVGNAARLIRRFRGRVRFSYGLDRWLAWDGRRWRIDEEGRIVRFCKATALAIMDEAKRAEGDRQQELMKWAFASQKRDRLTAMAALAQPEVAVTPDELDSDSWAFNCLNGTIDLRTGTLRPHRQSDLITKMAPVEFDPTAVCPRFDAFLARTFDGNTELIRYLQRWHGHCLTSDIREQYILLYIGEGNNGKNVLLDTISAIMGDYAGEAPPDLVTVRKHPEHPTEIADLMGKRLVIASETERDAELRLQLIKRLTGNARLKARKMRQDYFEFPRTHKMILVTNNKPVVRENTEAAWRRLRLVPFAVVIPKAERDTQLTEKLRAEWPGILAWMVRGCVDWLREGLAEPADVVVATQAYRGAANSLDAFLAQCCSLVSGLFCPSSNLMEAYAAWCAKVGMVPLKTTAFGEELKKKGCFPQKIAGQRGWVGVTLDRDPDGQSGQSGHQLPMTGLVGPA